MSLKALKKRENPYKKHPVPIRTRKLIDDTKSNPTKKHCESLPDLLTISNDQNIGFTLNENIKIKSKSDTDISQFIQVFCNNRNFIKSEICLKTISIHKTEHSNSFEVDTTTTASNSNLSINKHINMNNNMSSVKRRVSDQSIVSDCSDNRSIMTSGNDCENHREEFRNTSCYFHIPIIGYEVMEERARFTVYKLRIENPTTNDYWLVLRRYTDFVRLNNKIKQLFPFINLQLPRKKLFGDNFNTVFLDNRAQGLQMFVNSVMKRDELRNSKIVRDFFCLDEPPTYSESMEECRAIFEAQEETIAHLKMQINSKNDIILSLQQRLAGEISKNDKLNMTLNFASECNNCSSLLSKLGISPNSDEKKQNH